MSEQLTVNSIGGVSLKELQYLVAVAETKHFGNAAIACCVSQSTLSGQLRKLERYLGQPLVDRSNSDNVLTPLGEKVVQHARNVLRDVQYIVDAARSQPDNEERSLRVGIVPTLGPYLSPLLTPSICVTSEAATWQICEDTSDVLLTQLHAGQLDLMVMLNSDGAAGLHVCTLLDEPFFAALPRDHSSQNSSLIDAGDVANLAPILTKADSSVDIALAGFFSDAVAHESTTNVRVTTHFETALHLVSSGLGYTLIPALVAHSQRDKLTNVRLKPIADRAKRRIVVAWARNAPRTSTYVQLAAAWRGELSRIVSEFGSDL